MADDRPASVFFFAPFVSSTMAIEPGWIDYNGHLNMAYYHVLFDRAVDEAFGVVGLGPDYMDSGAARPSRPRSMCATAANWSSTIQSG